MNIYIQNNRNTLTAIGLLGVPLNMWLTSRWLLYYITVTKCLSGTRLPASTYYNILYIIYILIFLYINNKLVN